jgi:hypothetical protein
MQLPEVKLDGELATETMLRCMANRLAVGLIPPTDVGKQTLVPYSADYFFFRKNE